MATEEARALNRRGANYTESGYTELSGVTTARGSLRLSTLLEVFNHLGSSLEEYRPAQLLFGQQGPAQINRVDDERDSGGNPLWHTHPRRRVRILIRAWKLIKPLLCMAQGEGKIGGTLDGEEASYLLAWARIH